MAKPRTTKLVKAHHPAALFAGLLKHEPGTWPRRVSVADSPACQVLPVDVNHSPGRTDDGTWGGRLALSAVCGIADEECAPHRRRPPLHLGRGKGHCH
ncbi:hypothetical protein [Embleya sp. NPDC059237]|uniref:hypothetical protein n=1 Tax=Embleya sp. NPDC059237 TaxID=3346784 RepID=UPI0036B3C12C